MAVRKRGTRWLYDFMIRGVRYRESIPEAQNRHEALQAEAHARKSVYEGRYGRAMRSTLFEKFVEEVFLPYAHTNRRRHDQDARVVKTFVDFFKGRALQEIPPMLIEQWKKKALRTPTPKGAAPKASTVNQKLAVLNRVFTLAVENGFLSQNPVAKVRRLKEGERRERVMTPDEEQAIREEMEADSRFQDLGDLFTLAVNTGMRASEMVGLMFSEVDLERRELHLPAERTKEAKSKTIPLNSAALEVLGRVAADRGGEGRVFPDEFTYQRAGQLWREACSGAKVRDLRLHDLRHTFASRLLEAGVMETDIGRILGHSTLKMTARYAHSSEASRRRAVEALSQNCHHEPGKVAVFGKK
jgi:integrase